MEKEPESQIEHILPFYLASVKVCDPQPDPIKGFYTYMISGSDDIGSFQIRRRYNDFFYLRQALAKKWPGVYIPPIPQKKIAGNKDVQNIEIRKKFFDFFMKKIGKIKHLFTCSITRQFLRNKNLDMEKFCTTMPFPKYEELVGDYRIIYQKLALKNQHTQQVKNTIQNFGSFLKKAQKQLQGLRSQVEIIVEARTGFTQNLNICNTTMLPQYQKNVYSQYLPQQQKKQPSLIFADNLKVLNSIKALKEISTINSFSVCLDHISYELLQIKAMQEALKIKQKYETDKKDKQNQLLDKQSQLAKLNSGKTTFKSIFSRGSKNEQISKFQKQIPDLQKQIAALDEFNNILTMSLGLAEIPIFKRNKQLQYYRMMYEVSENQIKYLAAYGQFMKSVMQGLTK